MPVITLFLDQSAYSGKQYKYIPPKKFQRYVLVVLL